MDKGCKGCYSYTYNEIIGASCSYGLIKNIPNIDKCPCQTCLVKVVCVRLCNEFKEYLKVHQQDKERVYGKRMCDDI